MNLEITILCVGGVKTSFLREGLKQYEKWLSRYIKISVKSVKNGGDVNKIPARKILHTEAKRLIKYINRDSFNILLDKDAKQFSSEEFASFLDRAFKSSKKGILFVIGGVLGVDEELRKKFDKRISLSKMTFTHELAVLILIEQLYRAFKILNNEKYHY